MAEIMKFYKTKAPVFLFDENNVFMFLITETLKWVEFGTKINCMNTIEEE